jgi:hypothetical protein
MVFVYHGKDSELAKEVAEARETINARYLEVLGEKDYAKLQRTVNRLLSPECYFDSVEEVNSVLGENIQLSASNKMLLGIADDYGDVLKLDRDGRIKVKSLETAIGFYISPEGFRNSGSARFTDRPIASYVHEFDHFVWYALQKVPLYFAELMLADSLKLKEKGESHSSGSLDLSNVMPKKEEGLSTRERVQRLALGMYTKTLHETYEKSNKILDRMVLESIDIDVPLDWRHKEREYEFVPLPTRQVLGVPIGGDPFKELSDEEAVERVINWGDHFNLMLDDPYLNNLIESLKGITVSKVPLQDLKREEDLESKKGTSHKRKRRRKKK